MEGAKEGPSFGRRSRSKKGVLFPCGDRTGHGSVGFSPAAKGPGSRFRERILEARRMGRGVKAGK